jgi:hypothetical protein
MQRVLTRMDGRARWRAGGGRIGRGQQQPLIGELVHGRGGIAHGDAATVEAWIAPADIVHQENEDIRLLAGFLGKLRELVLRGLVLLGMLDHRIHIVGRLHVLEMDILLRVIEAGCRGRPGRGAADILRQPGACGEHRQRRRCGAES